MYLSASRGSRRTGRPRRSDKGNEAVSWTMSKHFTEGIVSKRVHDSNVPGKGAVTGAGAGAGAVAVVTDRGSAS